MMLTRFRTLQYSNTSTCFIQLTKYDLDKKRTISDTVLEVDYYIHRFIACLKAFLILLSLTFSFKMRRKDKRYLVFE